MPFELDHIFVFSSLAAPEADRLVTFGLTEGSGNVHHGQGTANRRFFFRNAMLELIWVHDEREAQSAAIARTGLSERAQFRRTGASPFGICIRPSARDATPPAPPFETWSYRPPYLPAALEIPVARALLAEPLVFTTPVGGRSNASPPPRREPIEHANGWREISGVRVTLAGDAELTPALRTIAELGIATFVQGPEHLMELSFDGSVRGASMDLRPELPLVLRG